MKKTLLSVALLSLTTLSVQANDDVSYEVGIKNDYRFNGISVSDKEPVVQGQIKYKNEDNGWYVGTWASSTGDNEAFDAEVEVFGGKTHTFENNVGLDVGLIANTFHGNSLSDDLNYTEVKTDISYEGFTASFNYTDDFMGSDLSQLTTKLSYTESLKKGFLNLSVSIIDNEENIYFGEDSYTAWEIGYLHPVSEDLELSLSYVGTDLDDKLDIANIAQDGVVAGLNWKF
jgi:uncharacterized protein (TIGR02001 family)